MWAKMTGPASGSTRLASARFRLRLQSFTQSTWRHAFNAATGYEHQQTFPPACCGKIVAHLLSVEVYDRRSRFNVALPIDDHIDIVAPVKRQSIRDGIDTLTSRRQET